MSARPGRWVCGGVAVAVRALPPGRRDRYRQEFEAEMYDMSAGERFRLACGVLSRAVSLRAALAESPMEDDVDRKTTWWGRLRCRLGQHDWAQTRAETGEYYHICTRCGRDDYRPSGGGTGGVEFGIMGGSH
jgi:hypothetical protein